jgi:hypothetical protein
MMSAAPLCDLSAWMVPPILGTDCFWKFYAENMRGSLFSGFLTLTGFLFAVKTFIVINMKKEMYDTEAYRARVWQRRNFQSELTVYGPLRRLGRLLLFAVLLSVSTSVSQLTLGLIQAWWAAAICLTLAGATITLLVWILFLIRTNLNEWFGLIEEEAKRKREREAQAGN